MEIPYLKENQFAVGKYPSGQVRLATVNKLINFTSC